MSPLRRYAALVPYRYNQGGEMCIFLQHRDKFALQMPEYYSFWGGKIESGRL